MIKIQNDLTTDRKDPLGQVLQDKRVHQELLARGVKLDRHTHPDFVFAMANGLKEVKENTISFERIDGCQIRNKKLLDNPNLLRLVKMYKYKELGANNLSCVDGRIFTRHLTEKLTPQKVEVTHKQWSKVVTGTSFLHYHRHAKCDRLVANYKFDTQPEYDVFFAGSTRSYFKPGHTAGNLVSTHRLSCVKAINKLKCNVKCSDNKAYGADEYLRNIARARITVSPWGWGEACYRDYEGILLHTDVIKPESFEIETQPNIYHQVFYCKPDWSDLKEVVDKCLKTWDERREERAIASQRLMDWRQPTTIAGILEGIVKGVK